MRNNVKTTLLGILFLMLTVSPANARHGNWGGFGWFGDNGGLGFGGFGLGDHFGWFGGLGGFGGGFGFGFNNVDSIQTRFQDQFDSLKSKYDDGVANTTDFYTSSDYTKILDKTQLLTDRYDLFVTDVQHQIDRIPDLITLANDDLTYYNDLLTSYQSDTSIPSDKLDRIEAWINRTIDRVNNRIDTLNNQQSTLQTSLPTYQSFQTDLTTFLSDITAAGGGTSGGATTGTSSSLLEAVHSSNLSTVVVGSTAASCNTMPAPLSPASVPEPASAMLVVLALGAIAASRARPPRRGRG
jgi:hypothetical protein